MDHSETVQRTIGVILSYISLALNAVIGFLYVPLLLHFMGQNEYGLYQLMGSIIAYFSVMDFGLSSTIIRYYSKYKTLKDQKNMENVLAMSSIIYCVITVFILFVGGIFYLNLERIFVNSLSVTELISAKNIFIVLLLNIAVTIPSKIFDAVIVSHERFIFLKATTIIQIVMQPIVVIAVMKQYPNALGLVIVQTIFNILFIGFKVYYSFLTLKIKIRTHNFDKVLFRSMIGFSFFVFLGAIMDQLFWRTNSLILGIYASTAVVAIYGVATTIFNIYMSLSTVITSVFLPKVTSLVANGAPRKTLSDLFIRIGRVQFLILSCVLSGFILFGRQFINLWAGKEFEDTYLITLFLIIPFTVDLIQNIGLTILQAENKLAFRSIVFLVMSVVNIGISIPMAIYFGGIGCAFSTGLSFFIVNAIVMNFYYSRKIAINIKQFWIEIFKIGVPCLASMGLGCFLNYLPMEDGILNLGIKIVLYLLIFSPIMWIFALNCYEKHLLKSVFYRIYKKDSHF